MYVRRACLDDIGLFDAAAFPRGYGEENDFCMRACAAGWRNVIDDATYVFHERSQSFGSEKTTLMAAGRSVIDRRYSDYTHAIQVFTKSPQIALARLRVAQMDHLIARAAPVLPRALFVTATSSGGTPQTNRDLMLALSDAWEGWVLQCDSTVIRLYRMDAIGDLTLIQTHTLQEPVQPITHTSFEYDRIVAGWLVHYGFDLVHIRQLIWHSLTLPRLAKTAGAYVVNSFHDFYTLSPSLKLLDENNRFCGATCDTVYAEQELWPKGNMPPLDPAWITIWQQRFADALAYCDAFVTTSPSARKMLLSPLPASLADRFVVIPHGRDFDAMQQSVRRPKPNKPIRILVPGNISVPKGRALIEKLLDRDAKERRFEFHILGDHDFLTARDRLYFHGLYDRSDFAEHVHRIAPDVGAVFSIWDETYCHTLTEMWAAGLPVIGLDYPTVAGRIHASGAGWVYSDADIEALYTQMSQDLSDQVGFDTACSNLTAWQKGEGIANSTRIMAMKYQALYQSVMASPRKLRISPDDAAFSKISLKPRIAVVCPAGCAQDTAPASTHIRMWARTMNAVGRDATFVRLTPAQLLAAVQTGEIAKAIVQRNAIPTDIWEHLKPFVENETLQFVFELDDDLTAVPLDKDPNRQYADYGQTLRDIIAMAKVVLVSTHVLADVIKPLNRQVEVVPNRLAAPVWRGHLPDRIDDGMIRAVYMGNNTHDEDFALVREACEAISRKHPDFRLRLIGVLSQPSSNLPDWIEVVDVPGHTRDYPAFVAFLRAQVAELDFGIAPLADTSFNASKSNLKVLDYCGLGLPAIVSDHLVYNSLSGPDHIDFVKSTKADWEAAIARRVADGQLDAKTRVSIRNWVAQEYLLDTQLAAFDAISGKFLSKEVK
jgi:glycosyltransferase involved in cell wall biosynthesis